MKSSINIIKKTTVATTMTALLVACSLEPELTSTYTEDVLWKNENNVELYLNSFYPLIGSDYYADAIGDDGFSDIAKMTLPHSNQNLWAFGSVTIEPANNIFDNWSWGYNWVTQINRFLDGLKTKGAHLPRALREKAEGEARFFRAHVYFMMARRYDANLIIYPELPVLGDSNHAMSTPNEVWDFIQSDLEFAALHLPAKESAPSGKLTSGAAHGLLARTMLYAGRWKVASDAAATVMSMDYDLYPDYGDMFTIRRTNGTTNKESIIEFGFIKPELAYNFDSMYSPPGESGFCYATPTEDLVSQYEMADGTPFSWSEHGSDPYTNREPRFYASVLYNGAPWKGRLIETFEGGLDGWGYGGNTTCTGYYLRKFLDPEMTTFDTNDFTCYYMRFAEVLLIYAEAQAELNDIPEALKALNRVRARVNLPPVTAAGKEDFMSKLRHERMVELAFEGHRFWDLRRWDLAKSTLGNTHLTGVKPVKQGSTVTYQIIDCDNGRTRIYLDKYRRFPIPYTEIKANKLIEQFEEWR